MIKKSTALKFLVLVILTILTLILLKNDQFKTNFYKYVYEDNISFAQINKWYQNKFGSSLPFSKYFENIKMVYLY